MGIQIILLLETRSSCGSDFRYIKCVMDYFYVQRNYKLSKIYTKTKSELIKSDKKINALKSKYIGESVVIVCADYDRDDDFLNKEIQKYCSKHSYELVWMNSNIEEVFLGKCIKDRDKNKESFKFLTHQNSIIPSLTNISVSNPLSKRPASNILIVLDKYLERIT